MPIADFDVLDGWLASRCGTALPIPPKFKPYCGLRDPADMLLREVPPDALDLRGLCLGITYCDSEQQISSRPVHARRAWRVEARGWLTAFCELRSEPRMFRIDRMVEVIDLRTGEIHRPWPFFEELGIHEPDVERRHVLEAIRDALRVLVGLAESDRCFSQDEIEAMVSLADKIAFDHGISLSENDFKKIKKVAAMMCPEPAVAREALARCIQSERTSERLVAAIRDLVYRDDRYTIDEKQWIENVCSGIKDRLTDLK